MAGLESVKNSAPANIKMPLIIDKCRGAKVVLYTRQSDEDEATYIFSTFRYTT